MKKKNDTNKKGDVVVVVIVVVPRTMTDRPTHVRQTRDRALFSPMRLRVSPTLDSFSTK